MTPELKYLVWSAVLTFVLVLISASGAQLQVGLETLAGNREDLPKIKGWAGRAQRAHLNMLENMILFAILVLVAQAAGVRNGMTLLGAQLFFWGRVAHAVLYIAGIPWARTAAPAHAAPNSRPPVVEAFDVVEVVDAGVDRLHVGELGVDVVEVPRHGARHAVADAFLDRDGAEAVREAVADGRAHAGRGGYSRDQDRIDAA
jgi:uncharacterized MAPEG superfamily protein